MELTFSLFNEFMHDSNIIEVLVQYFNNITINITIILLSCMDPFSTILVYSHDQL